MYDMEGKLGNVCAALVSICVYLYGINKIIRNLIIVPVTAVFC